MKHSLILLALFLTACAHIPVVEDTSLPPEAKASEVLEVKDGDTITLDPTRVRKNIGGKDIAMYGYNGQIPGPIIKAPQGATITVHVTNQIDHETTVHWHGLRHDNKDDGVPGLTQDAIQPGESFTYTVKFPDDGIYWYHPHVREDLQQGLGLYGAIQVQQEFEERDPPLVHSQALLVLDDLLLDDDGNSVPFGIDAPNFALMGRFGSELLVNMEPAGTYTQTVPKGSIIRFNVLNTANTRTFRIAFDGLPMKRVMGDMGYYTKEEFVDSLTIAPAERYSFDVLFEDVGTYTLRHKSPLANVALGNITVVEGEVEDYPNAEIFSYEHDIVGTRRSVDAFRSEFDRPVDKTLVLDIEMEMMHNMNHGMMAEHTEDGSTSLTTSGIEWEDTMPMMNKMMDNDKIEWKLIDEATGDENMDIHWKFKKGDVAKMRIINKADSDHPMQHPIHLHGQRFLVLSAGDKENTNLVWKDTVLVPAGSSVDILVDMSNPGDWMMHCHIAEHLSNGMMGMFTVSE